MSKLTWKTECKLNEITLFGEDGWTDIMITLEEKEQVINGVRKSDIGAMIVPLSGKMQLLSSVPLLWISSKNIGRVCTHCPEDEDKICPWCKGTRKGVLDVAMDLVDLIYAGYLSTGVK